MADVVKVTLNGTTLIDHSDATVAPDKVLSSYVGYEGDGDRFVGTYEPQSASKAHTATFVGKKGGKVGNCYVTYDGTDYIDGGAPSGNHQSFNFNAGEILTCKCLGSDYSGTLVTLNGESTHYPQQTYEYTLPDNDIEIELKYGSESAIYINVIDSSVGTVFTATITNTGDSDNIYVQHNGTKYYTLGDTFSFSEGDEIYLYANTSLSSGYSEISIDGVTKVSVQDAPASYTYLASTKNIRIAFTTLPRTAVVVATSREAYISDKSVTLTSNTTTIVPSVPYTAMSQVTATIGPSYIIPSGTSSITANGTYDVKSYASAFVNVAGGGSSMYTATLVNDGDSSLAYVRYPGISGTKYYTRGSTFSFTTGDSLYLFAYPTMEGGATISIDGTTVASGYSATYTYTLPACDIRIYFSIDSSRLGDTSINVATATEAYIQSNRNITLTSSPTVITPTGPFNAMSQVSATISPSYVIPSGTFSITANGTYNVKNYLSAFVSVDGGSGGNSKDNDIIERTISGTYENSSITKVGICAFYNCQSLTSINLPQVNTISKSAFYSCTSLTDISIPQCSLVYEEAFC